MPGPISRRVAGSWSIRSFWFISSIWFIWFIWLRDKTIQIIQTNQIDLHVLVVQAHESSILAPLPV